MFDNSVTRNPFGLTNARDSETFSDLPVLDLSKIHHYLDDFDYYNGPVTATTTNGYTLSGVGATVTFASLDDGAINLNALTTGFIASLQRATSTFSTQIGFRTWFQALMSLSTLASAAQVIAGLTNLTATPFTAITDGVWFSSDAAGAGALSINVAVGSVVTTKTLGVNIVAGQPAVYKWYWDGGVYASAPLGRVVWEVSGPGVSANARGSVPAPVNFPGATLMAPQVGLKATAGTPALTLDLLMAVKDRNNLLATPAF